MDIGMIGVQSGHFDYFTRQINLEKRFPGVRVTSVWGGDEPSKLETAASDYGITHVCQTVAQLFDHCDTVFVLQRNGYVHMEYARAAQEHGKALFVDKPFAISLNDAEELIHRAKQKSLPLTGGSTLTFLPEIPCIREECDQGAHTIIAYRADPHSIYGGWTYYGSHLCDLCSHLCGLGAKKVSAHRDEEQVTVIVSYPNKHVILQTDTQRQCPEVISSKGSFRVHRLDDDQCFRYGLDHFVRELSAYNDSYHGYLRFSAQLLEASLKSLQLGQPVML